MAEEELLLDEEKANAASARNIVLRPTIIETGSILARLLASSESIYILPFEHACFNDAAKGPRFLATIGVFSCIAVFAWEPSGRAFGAHIAMPTLHLAARQNPNSKLLLPEICAALKFTFKKVLDLKTVRVHLVGGQAAQDVDKGLASSFPGDPRKHSFAWHVIGAVQAAGLKLDQESTLLLNVFPGIPFHPRFEQEQRCKGHSFSLVGLDRRTGNLVTHTLFENSDSYRMACLGERGRMEERRYAAEYDYEHTLLGRRSIRVG